MLNGAELRRQTELLCRTFDCKNWQIRTNKGAFSARTLINFAGLYGDLVDERLTGTAAFIIKSRKGQFVVYDKAEAPLLRTTILPVPNERTKGIDPNHFRQSAGWP